MLSPNLSNETDIRHIVQLYYRAIWLHFINFLLSIILFIGKKITISSDNYFDSLVKRQKDNNLCGLFF